MIVNRKIPAAISLFMPTILHLFCVAQTVEGIIWDKTYETANVIRVHDGDTISIKIRQRRERVRLIGIDAPELHQAPWGQKAKQHLKKLLGNSTVMVETDVEKKDRYGRLLAYIWTSDGRFANFEMVRDGFAMTYTVPPNVKYIDLLHGAQRQAREKKRGMWGWGKNRPDESPGQYRKGYPR